MVETEIKENNLMTVQILKVRLYFAKVCIDANEKNADNPGYTMDTS